MEQRPWDNLDRFKIYSNLLRGERNPIPEKIDCEGWYLDLIDQCGALDPEGRPNMQEVVARFPNK